MTQKIAHMKESKQGCRGGKFRVCRCSLSRGGRTFCFHTLSSRPAYLCCWLAQFAFSNSILLNDMISAIPKEMWLCVTCLVALPFQVPNRSKFRTVPSDTLPCFTLLLANLPHPSLCLLFTNVSLSWSHVTEAFVICLLLSICSLSS
jgi:hypothetical protein